MSLLTVTSDWSGIGSIKIEKNLPIPKIRVAYSEFPFANMEVGDSFFVSNKRLKKVGCSLTRIFVYNKAKEFIAAEFRDDKYRIFLDRENKGVRCFRVE